MNESKQTNPKDALGIKKSPLSTLPTQVAFEVGLAMLEGGRKYGRHNYRIRGVRASVYYDACLRHLMSWWEGEDVDEDSGLNHIVKAAACLFVLRDSILMGNWDDDRPPCHPDKLNLKKMNKHVEKILEKYPDCVDPYTELEENLVDEELQESIQEEFGFEVAEHSEDPRYCSACAYHTPRGVACLRGVLENQETGNCKHFRRK